jgi:hypothetical protein
MSVNSEQSFFHCVRLTAAPAIVPDLGFGIRRIGASCAIDETVRFFGTQRANAVINLVSLFDITSASPASHLFALAMSTQTSPVVFLASARLISGVTAVLGFNFI